MNEHFIEVKQKARYVTFGNPNAAKLLLVLHGYGQLVEFFIKKFESLDSKEYFVVAPEGLHRFYLEGTSGRVGASWMTKELRELDIETNLNYLENLMVCLLKNRTYPSITLLGFSQGGATAARWFSHSALNFEQLILWACVFPEDVTADFSKLSESTTKKTFVIGEQDQFYPENKRQELIKHYENLGFSVLTYPGNHSIDPKIVSLLAI